VTRKTTTGDAAAPPPRKKPAGPVKQIFACVTGFMVLVGAYIFYANKKIEGARGGRPPKKKDKKRT
jgi:hypothetical protein